MFHADAVSRVSSSPQQPDLDDRASQPNSRSNSRVMSDPFSIVSAAISVVSTASDTEEALSQAIATIGNGPADVRSLQSAARNISSGITRLTELLQSAPQGRSKWPDDWLTEVARLVDATGIEFSALQAPLYEWSQLRIVRPIEASWTTFTDAISVGLLERTISRLHTIEIVIRTLESSVQL